MKNSEGINFIILTICPLNKFHVPQKKKIYIYIYMANKELIWPKINSTKIRWIRRIKV